MALPVCSKGYLRAADNSHNRVNRINQQIPEHGRVRVVFPQLEWENSALAAERPH